MELNLLDPNLCDWSNGRQDWVKKLSNNAGISTVPGFLGEVEKDEEI